jgi:hypothetical protein
LGGVERRAPVHPGCDEPGADHRWVAAEGRAKPPDRSTSRRVPTGSRSETWWKRSRGGARHQPPIRIRGRSDVQTAVSHPGAPPTNVSSSGGEERKTVLPQRPLGSSQILTVRSSLLEATRRPSGEVEVGRMGFLTRTPRHTSRVPLR